MIDHAGEYQRQAERCLQQAQQATRDIDKAEWLRMSEAWLRMAAEADEL